MCVCMCICGCGVGGCFISIFIRVIFLYDIAYSFDL